MIIIILFIIILITKTLYTPNLEVVSIISINLRINTLFVVHINLQSIWKSLSVHVILAQQPSDVEKGGNHN